MIGACIAYFLARRGVDVTVVERTGVACAASGKAGGFLALDWCAGSPLDALARRSFTLHAELAREMDGDWAYQRRTPTAAQWSGIVTGADTPRRPSIGSPMAQSFLIDWARPTRRLSFIRASSPRR